MAIAGTVFRYLTERRIPYDVLSHSHTGSSMETAQVAHIPGVRVAKSVVLEDDHGYVMVVLPASRRLDLGELHHQLKRPLGLVSERELSALFQDCDMGAVPAVGPAYGIETVVDDTLVEQPDVYMEAGDHEQLIHLSGEDFESLLEQAQYLHISRHW
ncbi:MAG: YbaK/EbsC family protein [Gammaproteobacteria bacterium]